MRLKVFLPGEAGPSTEYLAACFQEEGVVRALQETGAAGEIMVTGHNLTPKTQAYLLEGSMDIVLHQNMRRAAREAVAVLTAHLEHRTRRPAMLAVEIITRENTLGADFG